MCRCQINLRDEDLSAISQQNSEESLAIRCNYRREKYASKTRHDTANVNSLSMQFTK